MKFSLLNDLPTILERFTKRYLVWRGLTWNSDINCGECFIWAWHVYQYLKRRGVNAELVSCVSHGGHAWVEVEGLAYDSEHIDGVNGEYMLEDFLGFDLCFLEEDEWEDIDVKTMDEVEFLDHWYFNGKSGFLLMSPTFMERMTRVIAQCGRGWKSNNLKVS